jgi:hypothetical protein
MAKRRIGGAGGGSDPGKGKGKKKGKGGPIVAGAVLAGLLVAAEGGTTTESVGAALDSASAASTSTDARTADSQQAARKGDEAQAWRRMGIRELKKITRRGLRCTIQSYGQVRQFFLSTPCRSLDQRLFAFADTDGNEIAVSVVWVRMSSADDADRLTQVEDVYGTGDITPVATQVLRAGGIRFTGKHYASRTDGSLAVVAETEPLRGNPSASLLDDTAKVVDVLPAP